MRRFTIFAILCSFLLAVQSPDAQVLDGETLNKTEVTVADPVKPDFQPRFTLAKWNGEVDFTVTADLVDGATAKTEDGKLKYVTPEYEVHLYDKGGDTFEVEWILPAPPASNVLKASIQSKGLDFFYQPPLRNLNADGSTWETDAGGGISRRPANINGSYAVYARKTGAAIGGKNYFNGKVAHILHPEAIDAKGAKIWCDLKIADGLMTVTVPQPFLDSASYPIVVDPEFGYHPGTPPGTSYEQGASWMVGSPATLSVTGTLSQMSGYLSDGTGGGGSAQFAVYTDADPRVLKDYTGTVSTPSVTPAWTTLVNVTNGATLTAGSYRLYYNGTADPFGYYDSAPSGESTPQTFGSWPSSVAASSFFNIGNKLFGIYATYTTSGGTVHRSLTITGAGAMGLTR